MDNLADPSTTGRVPAVYPDAGKIRWHRPAEPKLSIMARATQPDSHFRSRYSPETSIRTGWQSVKDCKSPELFRKEAKHHVKQMVNAKWGLGPHFSALILPVSPGCSISAGKIRPCGERLPQTEPSSSSQALSGPLPGTLPCRRNHPDVPGCGRFQSCAPMP